MANKKTPWERDDNYGPDPHLRSNYVSAIDLVPVQDKINGELLYWQENGKPPCKRITSKRPHHYYERGRRAGKTADEFDPTKYTFNYDARARMKSDLKDLLDFLKNQT